MENMSYTNLTFFNYHKYMTYGEYRAAILIWKLVPPVLIALGTIGNMLSILVLTRTSIRNSTTAFYLTVLALSDLVVLYTGLLRHWLIHLFDTDVRKISEFGCKMNIWFVYSSLHFSAWILIVVTLERVISVWLPHKARSLCTKRRAKILMISVGVFILGLNSHLLYGIVFKTSLDENGNIELNKCVEINDDYAEFFNVTWPWIDFFVFCFIPFTIIIIGNALILFKVIKSRKKVKSGGVHLAARGRSLQRAASSSHGSKQSSLTAMLFTLNVVFLFSTSPVSIYNIGYPFWAKGANEYENAQLDFWWAVVTTLMYVNNSINFLLYCLSGTKFRQEVFRLFSFSRRQCAGIGSILSKRQSNNIQTEFDIADIPSTPRHSTHANLSISKHRQFDINDVEENGSIQQIQITKF